MTFSQSEWHIYTSPPAGTVPGHITGRVKPEDVETIFRYLCDRIDREVENIRQDWSWGWANRNIRGSTFISRHALAVAVDINAPAHPLGVRGTWSAEEKRKVHSILDDLDNVLRWGEDYSGRVDGMHFEVNDSAAAVSRVAAKIRNGQMPDQKPQWKPKQAKAVHFGRVQEQFLIAAGAQAGELSQSNGVGLIQDALNKALGLDLEVDGYVGDSTLRAWGQWEAEEGGSGRPRVPDRTSVEALAEAAGLRLVGEPWDDPMPTAKRKKK